ncbi:MAG TPA: choice-of-anchor D domain-containing protein [Acidisarcina sp.]|nr:choice-of-anchor D domain-containing protein [Acidisarcina sp.]
MRLILRLHRLGIALLAFSAFGMWNLSAPVQSAAQVTIVSASAPVRARSISGSGAMRRTSAARFLARRTSAGVTPARLLAQARQQSAAMPIALPAATTSLTNPWQPVGPAQVVSPYYDKVTGRVTSIAIDRADSTGNTVYVGTTGGGVWKSTNAAASASQVVFSPLTDTLPAFSSGKTASLSIGAISVQPGGTGVLLAGTGDPNDALDSYYGSGLLRSTDNGVTWSLIDQTSDALIGPYWNVSFIGEGFAGFAWSTTSPNLVVAAVSEAAEGTIVNSPINGVSVRGLYYSTDAGATWHLATITNGPYKTVQGPGTDFTGWGGSAATAVVWNPIRKMFYAAVRYHGYYSSPDGITWTRLTNQPGPQLAAINCPITPGSAGSTSCAIFRGALAVQSVTGDLFAFTVDQNNKDIGLWQDACNLQSGACASSTVTFAHQVATTALEATDGSKTIVQGTYNLWLAAVPSQADTLLYTGTVDISRCSLLNSCVWRNTTNATTCGAARVSPSQHAVDFLPGSAGQVFPGLMFFGNDGGLWRTTDGAQQSSSACSTSDAQSFDNLNGSLGSLAELTGLAQHPTDGSVYLAGLGANGTAAPVPGQAAWPQVLDGEGATTAIDPANPQNWYTTSASGVSIQRCTLGAACTPADFGQPAIGETQVSGDGLTMPVPAAYALDAADPSQMLVGTCRVWLGPANGAGWSSANAISGMLDGAPQPACNGNALIRSLAGSPAPSGEWLYAGMDGLLDGGGAVAGHVFQSWWTGSATAWKDLSTSPVVNASQGFNPGAFAVSSIVADAHDATGQTVYVTIEGFSGNGISAALVYRSTDAGGHWTNVNSNLPSAPANSLVVDPGDANTVYVALDTGVYVTRQIADCSNPLINCWSVYGVGLPNAPVTQLRVLGGSNPMLRAGTYGRGIWEIPLAASQSTGTTATVSPTSLTFADQVLQTASAQQTVTLTNTGTQPLLVTKIAAVGDFAQQNNCSTAIPAQGTCSIQVSFIPTQLGARSGTLTVYANIPSGQLTVALSGNGVGGANIVLLPTSLNFGTVATGTTSAAQNLTISNTGGTTIALGAMSVTGPYRITANTCGASLAPTYGCTVGIAFAPTVSGAAPGSFSVTDSLGTQTASLSGTGATSASDNLTPLALTFPAQLLATNSSPQLVTLTNNGDSALMPISAQTTGDFSVTSNCGASLAGHSSCAFSVVFHPTRAGQETGTLTVSDPLGTHTVALSGTGLAPAGISIAPTTLDFGGVGVGGSSAQSVTLTNNGGVSLTSIAFAATGDFALAANGCGASLAAGASCSFQVVFSPSQAGARTGNLTVTSSSATSFNVPLNGFGEDFSLVVVGSPSATVVTGQTASYALSLVPVAGSSGTVSLACTGAPKNTVCTVSPASAQVTGGNSVSISVQVTTGVSVAANSSPAFPRPAGHGPGRGQDAARGLLTLALLLPVGWGLRRRRSVWMVLLLVCLAFAPLGCGVTINGGKQSPPPNSPPGSTTPPGTYALTITATAPGIQRTAALNLTVE